MLIKQSIERQGQVSAQSQRSDTVHLAFVPDELESIPVEFRQIAFHLAPQCRALASRPPPGRG